MEATETKLPGVVLVTPRVWTDKRGYFVEAFNTDRFAGAGLPTQFVQDNHSRSKGGVLRGLHYQLERPQGKLVSVIRGKIFDVAADVRRGSPSFGEWIGVVLDDLACQSLWIPPGFAHGFCVMSEDVDVVYKCTDYYYPAGEKGVRWNDPLLSIQWPVKAPLISDKDIENPTLSPDRADLPSLA